MPELAAHLERVADDVTDKLANAAAFYTLEYMAAKERGEHMPHGLDSVLKPIVAAALAACAREAKLEQASELEHPLLAARNFVRGRHSTLTYGPDSLLKRLDLALLQITKLRLEVTGERAVGEKGKA